MAPSRPDDSKVKKQFGFPLFCGAWAPTKGPAAGAQSAEGLVVLAGGGGAGRHGIKSKIIACKYSFSANELSDEVFSLSTGANPAFKITAHPNGDGLIAAFGDACRLFEVRPQEEEQQKGGGEAGTEGKEGSEEGGVPLEQLQLVQSAVQLKRGEREGERGGKEEEEEKVAEVKCLLFSADGCRVVAGSEDGRLRVFEWPSMEVAMEVPRAHTSSLRDADINLDGSLVATTADAGPLRVWSVRKGTAVATLSIAEGGARFGLCRFSPRPSKPLLYSTCVKAGKGWVVVWETAAWRRVAVRKIHNDPISAFAISPDSTLLATGTPEGNVFIVDARTLSVRQRVVGAHLALLSVSGDSSARVTAVAAKPAGQAWVAMLILTALGLLALALLLSASDLVHQLLGPEYSPYLHLLSSYLQLFSAYVRHLFRYLDLLLVYLRQLSPYLKQLLLYLQELSLQLRGLLGAGQQMQ
ncbi:hypothetical protein CLOP_g21602 [Closterium sp. NIES-67]|nr:hypothetical protein CLOP_g21602 [Closterium sp. NIES-67]